jgi:type I restriction enzyme S subunit
MSQKYGLIPDNQFAEHRLLSANYIGGKLCYTDDLVLNRLKAHLGVFALAPQKGVISPDYTVLEINKNKLNPAFAQLVLHCDSCRRELRIRVRGVVEGFWRLYTDDFNTIELPLPSLVEQDQIIRFLDWKVSQINRIINAKKKQIGLLQEQKRAVVSTAIPQSGEQARFKDLFTLFKGLNITKANLSESGIPCVSYGQIHSKYGFEVNPDIHHLPFVAESYLDTSPKSLMKYGDFVFADTSEDLAGSGNFTYLNSQAPVFAGYHTIIARPRGKCNYRYLAYYFDSPQFRSQIQQRVNGVKVYSITRTILNDTFIVLPTDEEPEMIVQLLDERCTSFARLIEKINTEISLLHEYRTRLISDVVTGKMDVRNVVVPQYENVAELAEEEPIDDSGEQMDE